MIDLKLDQIAEGGAFDIALDPDTGDFLMTAGFDTSIQASVLEERRADASEVPTALRRRGWVGNALSDTPGFERGSKIWLYEGSKLSNNTINGVKDAALDGLNWLITDNLAKSITAEVAKDIATSAIGLQVTIEASNSQVDQKFFTIWSNTGT